MHAIGKGLLGFCLRYFCLRKRETKSLVIQQEKTKAKEVRMGCFHAFFLHFLSRSSCMSRDYDDTVNALTTISSTLGNQVYLFSINFAAMFTTGGTQNTLWREMRNKSGVPKKTFSL